MPGGSEDNMSRWPQVDKLMASATQIKFPTGAFGKTCMLVAIIAFSCAGIAWSVREPWVAALALVIVAIIAIYAITRVFNFADKNPSAAILEGAEFVKHEQMQLAAKGLPTIPQSQTVLTSEPENVPLLEDDNESNSPDRISEGDE